MCLLAARFAAADERTVGEFFETRVWPVLALRCVACHGPEKQEGGLRLDSRPTILAGDDRGEPVAVPDDPAAGLSMSAIRHADEDLRMPPDSKLSYDEIEQLPDARIVRGDARTGVVLVSAAVQWGRN